MQEDYTMQKLTDFLVVETAEELGLQARRSRKDAGLSQKDAAAAYSFGSRFLSEFENGKPTSQIGKIIEALHASGLDLAVVARTKNNIKSACNSQTLKFEFPYDWSNPNMDESTLIALVLEKARFNDVLKIVYEFGLEPVSNEAEGLQDQSHKDLISKYLNRIEIGMKEARTNNK